MSRWIERRSVSSLRSQQAEDGRREHSCQNVPSDKSNYSQETESIFSLKEFLKPEPGLLGAIPEKCEVASLVVVVTG